MRGVQRMHTCKVCVANYAIGVRRAFFEQVCEVLCIVHETQFVLRRLLLPIYFIDDFHWDR